MKKYINKKTILSLVRDKRIILSRADSAFWAYVEMGERERSLRKIAKMCGVSLRAVEKWSAKGRWQARMRKIYDDIMGTHDAKTIAQGRKVMDDCRRIMSASIAVMVEKFKEAREAGTIEYDPMVMAHYIKLNSQLHGYLLPRGTTTDTEAYSPPPPTPQPYSKEKLDEWRRVVRGVIEGLDSPQREEAMALFGEEGMDLGDEAVSAELEENTNTPKK